MGSTVLMGKSLRVLVSKREGRLEVRWAEMKLVGWGSGRVDIQTSLSQVLMWCYNR